MGKQRLGGVEVIYFGSVRFFKHLIITVLALAVAAILSVAAYFIWFRGGNSENGDVLSVTQAVDAEGLRFAEAARELLAGSPDSFNQLCAEKGITAVALQAAVDAQTGGSVADEAQEPETQASPLEAEVPAYTKLYPELYVTPPTQNEYQEKTVYLTFDDGPSVNTGPILDTLQEYGIKATFFVVPKADGSDADRLRRIAQAGHTIGVHSATHEYETIYTDVESYLEDFNQASELIEKATGQKPDIFRFPGGSVNSYNRLVWQELTAEMTRRGYVYFDWHLDGNESGSATPESVYQAVMQSMSGKDRAVVLLHDGVGRWQAAEMLERLVGDLQEQGYRFDKLTNQVQPIIFASAK